MEYKLIVKEIAKEFEIRFRGNTALGGIIESLQGKQVVKAVDNFSHEFKKGKITGIIGPNGSGKSTLLRLIAGIYKSDRGSIISKGKILPMIYLKGALNPRLTTKDNIFIIGCLMGLTRKQVKQRLDSIIRLAGLEKFQDAKIRQFSEGMGERLTFSIAVHANPDILLLDEILAVGDENFKNKCIEIIKRYKEKQKIILFVSHELDLIGKYCDECIYMKEGRIISKGNTKKIIKDYVGGK